MEHDYTLLIKKLKNRRYDKPLGKHIMSDVFHQSGYSDCIRYTLESMMGVDIAYSYKVHENVMEIHKLISKGLKNKAYSVDFRYQGALKTYSNIMLYGDLEIIVIKKSVSSKPFRDVQKLSSDLLDILSSHTSFKSVNFDDKVRIKIITQKPTYQVSILPSMWVNSPEYTETKNEIYRGIVEFDFKNKRVKKYLPFLNIARINARNQHTNGNLKMVARLLNSLVADSEDHINLTDLEINAILYSMPKKDLIVDSKNILSLLPKVSVTLEKFVSDVTHFNKLPSPSKKDLVFGGTPEKHEEVIKLYDCLLQLISDLQSDLEDQDMAINSDIDYKI